MEEIKTLLNNKGEEVAVELIPEIELRRHSLVEGIIGEIEAYKKRGEELSLSIDKKIEDYLKWIGKKSKIKDNEDWIGNLALTNYSQTKQIKVSNNDIIVFDERLNVAKKKVDNCLKRWAEESSNTEQSKILALLAQQAFQVDKKGQINKSQIIRLTKINIKDKEWIEAQKLIHDSMQVYTNKTYKNFRTRSNSGENWGTINLNFSTF